jgi:hypothetical protein
LKSRVHHNLCHCEGWTVQNLPGFIAVSNRAKRSEVRARTTSYNNT